MEVIDIREESDEEESSKKLKSEPQLCNPVKGTNNIYASSDSENGELSDTQTSPNPKRYRNNCKSLEKAVAEIKKGQSLANVASQYGISEDILYDKLISRTLPSAMDILTPYEETCMVNWILKASKKNILVFRNHLMERVGKLKKILKITPVFAKSKFGRSWYNYFMKSHPEIYENEGLLLPSDRVLAHTVPQDMINKKENLSNLPYENILTSDEESNLVKWIIESNKKNSLVFKHQLMGKVGRLNKVMKKSPLFAKSKMGKLWFENFMKKHPEIHENDELLLPSDNTSIKSAQQWPGKDDIKAHEMFKTEAVLNEVKREEVKSEGIKTGEHINRLLVSHGIKEVAVVLKDFRKEENSLISLIKKENDCNVKSDIKTEGTDQDQDLKEVKQESSVNSLDNSKFENVLVYQGSDEDQEMKEVKHEYSFDKFKSSIFAGEKANSSCNGRNKMHQINIHFKKRRHKNTKNQEKLTCEICSRTCYSRAKLKLHMLAAHQPKEMHSVSCAHCSKTFPSKYHLTVHLKSNHNLNYYKCEECKKPKYFSHKTSLYNHMRKVHLGMEDVDVFYCDICEKAFKYKNSLEAHIVYGHLKLEKKFKCNICKKLFIKQSMMLRHKMRHTKVKPFSCTHCDRRFTRKYLLREHIKIHTEEDSVIDECDKISQEYLGEILLD